MGSPAWDTLTVVGVGLLGGSIGMAARERGIARRVVGWGRSPATLDLARSLGAIDVAEPDFARAVGSASLIVVCTPVERVAEQACEALRLAPPDALVTDVGSTKAEILSRIDGRLGDSPLRRRFIGSHPIAGSERTGVQAASADLFVGRTAIVTPTGVEADSEVARIEQFWQSLGAKTTRQSPAEHDRAFAALSHLPHLAAAALAAATPEALLPLAGSGWRDTTRVALGDVELWRQIFASNRAELLGALDRYLETLAACRRALAAADDAELVRWLTIGRDFRNAVGN